MKSCKVIASDESNLLRKVDFLLKSSFHVIAFLILLEVGYLVIIVAKLCLQMSTTVIFGASQNNV